MKIVDGCSASEFKISRFNDLDKDAHIIFEMIDEELNNSSDEVVLTKQEIEENTNIDLSSFKPQKELNKKVFPNEYMDSRIRLKLLDIADDFIKTLEVDWVKPDDIILTGSLANYNWSKYSDFDLHILIDFEKVDKRVEFVKDYFNSKKSLWNDEHENLTIFDFPVEVYVQDTNEKHTASGIYSLEDNKWLKEPEPDNIKAIKLNKFFIKDKVENYKSKIEKLESSFKKEKDLHKIEKLSNKIENLLTKLKCIRKEGLDTSGEMSSTNLVYKLLRRLGSLDKLWKLRSLVYDKINSIN